MGQNRYNVNGATTLHPDLCLTEKSIQIHSSATFPLWHNLVKKKELLCGRFQPSNRSCKAREVFLQQKKKL